MGVRGWRDRITAARRERWHREAWPVVVYLADEGIGLYGLDPEWSDLRARLLDRCAATGLSPWQIATRALEAYLGDV